MTFADADQPQDLTIEVGAAPRATTCDVCGRAALNSSGFVYRGGDAFAIYHATLHRHDEVPTVDLAIGIGSWENDAALAEVTAFLSVWAGPEQIMFGFVDPAASVWSNSRLLANQQTAEVARTSPSRSDFTRVAEGIVREDPALARHLA